MKSLHLFTFVLATLTHVPAFTCGPGPKLWTLSEGLEGPESVVFDPRTENIFVSNVAGQPKDKDKKGWISRLNSQGQLINAQWVSGLNAPKGLVVSKNVLWVADIDQMISIDIDQGTILKKIPIKGSRFLNDVAQGPDGSIYVSDTETSSIHRLNEKGDVETFVSGPEWESPNGLYVTEDTIYVGAWGYLDDISKPPVTPGNFYSIDLKTKKKTVISKKPLGNLDGVWPSAKTGVYYVSDWVKGTVQAISKKGWVGNVKGFNALRGKKIQGTADISMLGYDLMIPSMIENKLYLVNGGVF
jgi:sugar lactone lactonase YvrE